MSKPMEVYIQTALESKAEYSYKDYTSTPIPTSSIYLPTPVLSNLMAQAGMLFLKYEKHFPKMSRDVGMAVPKTTESRCRDGSVQARQVIKRLHKQPIPTSFFLLEIVQ